MKTPGIDALSALFGADLDRFRAAYRADRYSMLHDAAAAHRLQRQARALGYETRITGRVVQDYRRRHRLQNRSARLSLRCSVGRGNLGAAIACCPKCQHAFQLALQPV